MRPSSAAVAMALSAAMVFEAFAGQPPAIDFTSTGSRPGLRKTDHLTVSLSSSRPASPGGNVSLLINVGPNPRMHVYAPGQKTYIPVSVQITEDGAIKVHSPVFPSPEKYFFKPLNETQLVYSKPFRIVQPITIAPALHNSSTLTITGALRYQACDDQICYLPQSVPLTWTLPLTVPDVIK